MSNLESESPAKPDPENESKPAEGDEAKTSQAGKGDSEPSEANGTDKSEVKETSAESKPVSSDAVSDAGGDEAPKQIIKGKQTLSQIRISKILDNVLEEENEAEEQQQEAGASKTAAGGADAQARKGKIGFPIIFDLLLGVGLLLAMGGFGIGVFHMYLVHTAQQSINQQNYDAAIIILRGAPFPELFMMRGSEAEELLNQALYCDALAQLNTGDENKRAEAIKELQQIRAGSRFFINAHKLIGEHDEPAPVMLQGGAEEIETDPKPGKEPSQLDRVIEEHKRQTHPEQIKDTTPPVEEETVEEEPAAQDTVPAPAPAH